MSLTLQPVRVATGSDEEGMLVFGKEQRLVAVLTHLSEENEIAPANGTWKRVLARWRDRATPPSSTWKRRRRGSTSASPKGVRCLSPGANAVSAQ